MRQAGQLLLAVLLVGPAALGQDPPKDDKTPPKERFDALVKELGAERQKIIAAYQKAGEEEQKKLFTKYQDLGKQYAEKIFTLAEENPKDPVAADAVFWLMSNATDTPFAKKVQDRLPGLVESMPLQQLAGKLPGLRFSSPVMIEAVVKRAEKSEADPQAAELLAWVATSGGNSPAATKAVDRLLEKYPDHAAIGRITQRLGFGGPGGEGTLKRILEKATKPAVKASAALALGKVLSARTDQLGAKPAEADKVAAEAEKYLDQAISIAGKENESVTKQAEQELKALRTLRVGKTVPEIAGVDLDDKEFKLSDYRGKVVLLDFWGHW